MPAASIKRDAVAIGLATGAYAISYGVLAVAAGLTVAQTCAMSLLVFTGASQFAVVGVLGAGGSVLAALAPALLLAARNALYGLSLVDVLRGRRFLALLAPQLGRPAARTAALYGGVLALVLVPFTPVGVPILAAVLGVVPATRALRRAAEPAA